MKEFAIIDSFFESRSYQRKDVILGIGDDCAITQVPEGQSLVITTDTLVSGVHFLPDTPADAIAHKALAVNLSDLAAMGAEPAWISLSLSLPEVDREWLDSFSASLHKLSEYYSVQLIGGDTVKGPLAITITAHGFVPEGKAITRSGAAPGDLLYVTGTLGDAGIGLEVAQGKRQVPASSRDFLLERLNRPTPRLLAGTALRRIASACIDVSDGILSDVQHLLDRSGCGAVIQLDNLPLSVALKEAVEPEIALQSALVAGDDYELLFTISEEQKGSLESAFANFNVTATCIGQLNGLSGKLELKQGDEHYAFKARGYEHFS